MFPYPMILALCSTVLNTSGEILRLFSSTAVLGILLVPYEYYIDGYTYEIILLPFFFDDFTLYIHIYYAPKYFYNKTVKSIWILLDYPRIISMATHLI